VVGEDKPLRNSVILYTHAKFGDYLGNIGLAWLCCLRGVISESQKRKVYHDKTLADKTVA